MKHSEIISTFVTNVLTGDSEAARAAFSAYCNDKAKSIGQDRKLNERLESLKVALLEYGVNYNAQTVSGHGGRVTSGQPTPAATKMTSTKAEPDLSMEGDKIIVNGKQVGRIQYDMEDWEGGINFISDDNTFSKEFNTAEELFKFLSQRFLGESTDE